MAPIVTPRLEIKALGRLHILRNGQPLKRSNDLKRELMLVYLAANPQPQARRAMAQLLWSYAEDKVALSNLRSLLTRMRQEGLEEYLAADRATISLASGVSVEFDVARFRKAMTNLAAHDFPSLQEIIEIYQGEFLKGIALRDQPELEEWILTNQRELQSLAVAGYQRLIALALGAGETATAVLFARRLLEITPYDDDNHELYIRALIADHQPGEALRHYGDYIQILEQELGIRGATPSLSALVEQVRSQTNVQAAIPTAATVNAAPPDGPVASARQNPPKFVGPRPTRALLGREADLAHLRRWLEAGATRLITITGLGGTGKTHFALALAESIAACFADGVYFVDLTSEQASPDQPQTQAGENIVQVIGRTLGVSFTGRQSLEEQLIAVLASQHTCLILDNFEQLLPLAPLLDRLLTGAPRLTLVVTSRVRLNISHEQVYPLGGLCVPGSDAAVAVENSPAVRLFVTEVQRRAPDYEPTLADVNTIARICQQVGGQPLALLLAASWSEHYALHELQEKLEEGLELLQSSAVDIPARHAGIETVLTSSWQRLTSREQSVLADLSVLTSPFGRDAAQQIADAAIAEIDGLIHWSLVEVAGPGHYRLHPLVRQFAETQLAQMHEDRGARAAARHAAYFGGWFLEMMEETDDRSAILTYYSNFQRALAWHVDHEPDWIVQHLDRLDEFWSKQGLLSEGRTWLRRLRNRTQPEQPAHALVLLKLGRYAHMQQDFGVAEALLLQARASFEEQDDKRNLATIDELLGWTLFDQAARRPEAQAWFQSSYDLRITEADESHLPRLLWARGACHMWRDLDEAERLFEEALAIARTQRNQSLQGAVYRSLMELAHQRGDIEELHRRYEIARRWMPSRTLSYGQAWAIYSYAEHAIALDRLDEAEGYHRQAEAAFRTLRVQAGRLKCTYMQATLHLRRGNQGAAAAGYETCLSQARSISDDALIVKSLIGLVAVALERHEGQNAARLAAAAQAYVDRLPAVVWPADRAQLAQQIAHLQEWLDAATFDACWQLGYGAEPDVVPTGGVAVEPVK